MKCGPLTFQCACLVCVWRSMQSASRALSSSTALTRVASGRSFFVLNMSRLLVRALKNGSLTPAALPGSCRTGQPGQAVVQALDGLGAVGDMMPPRQVLHP